MVDVCSCYFILNARNIVLYLPENRKTETETETETKIKVLHDVDCSIVCSSATLKLLNNLVHLRTFHLHFRLGQSEVIKREKYEEVFFRVTMLRAKYEVVG